MSVSTDDFVFVADFIRKRSAISIGPGKEYLVESRLGPLARAFGMPDVGSLIGELRRPNADPQVSNEVVEAMTTNETSFFRDIHPFATLKNQVLPELLTDRARQQRLRIWSAASSTGQELYSIAMLLDTDFPQLAQWNVELLGTDLSSAAVLRAQAGAFSPLEVNRGLPAPMLVRYLARQGATYVIDERVRRRCQFETMNLIGSWPARAPFDVIFCRNVLIYFEAAARNEILQRLAGDLAPGGYLFLGASEISPGMDSGLQAVRLGNTVVFRKKG